MRVLIGCETSGVMRRAFAARGHDVWSVDLLPAEDGSNRREPKVSLKETGALIRHMDEALDDLAGGGAA